ncbi:MAG TPA: energy transducer TonB [Rhizomicrobium sp.]|nr:energy transducer TonB [Rhizomicrobium sp.]
MSRNGIWFAAIGMVAVALSAPVALADDRDPKVDIAAPTPVVYPQVAQSAGEEGTVVVRVYVSDSGKPVRVSVARSSGYTDLDNAAVETAMNWRYVPAIRGGAIAADWANVQVVYKLPQNAAK